MEPARFDFEALQPSMLRMIRSARTRLHKEGRVEDRDVAQSNASSMDSTAAASRRRSGVVRRSSMGQGGASENIPQEKALPPVAPASVLGDATNTYCTGPRLSSKVGIPCSSEVNVTEKNISQGFPSPLIDGELDGLAAKSDNPQQVAEYAQDVLQSMRNEEAMFLAPPTYMDRQLHVNSKMRAILIDWLIDVHKKYKLRTETLFLAVQLTDRYLENRAVAQRHLQLVGVTSLMIAAKFEEVYPPPIKEYVHVCDKAYVKEDFLKMEVLILQALGFQICLPTAMHFLEQYQTANGSQESHRYLAQYLLELTLAEYKMLKYPASHLAAASLLLSNKLLRRPSWSPAVAKQTKMTEPMLKECAKEMCAILEGAETNSLQAARRKYAQAKYHSVSKLNFMVGPTVQPAPTRT